MLCRWGSSTRAIGCGLYLSRVRSKSSCAMSFSMSEAFFCRLVVDWIIHKLHRHPIPDPLIHPPEMQILPDRQCFDGCMGRSSFGFGHTFFFLDMDCVIIRFLGFSLARNRQLTQIDVCWFHAENHFRPMEIRIFHCPVPGQD